MADIPITALTNASQLSSSDLLYVAIPNPLSPIGFSLCKMTSAQFGLFLNKDLLFASDLETDSKNIIGAINELKAGGGGGGASVIQLTQAEYTALTTAEKMNGSIYKLTDKAVMLCLDEEYHAVKELTTAQYEALTTAEQNNGTIYIQTDAETTGSDIAVSDSDSTNIADAINAFNAKRITPTVSNIHTGMTVDASYRDVFDLGGFYYIAIKINITTAIGTWQSLFDIAEISTTQAVRFFAQHQTTTDKAICYCLNNSIQSQTALSTGDWWLIAVIPKI